MGDDVDVERLLTRADRLDAFAQRVGNELDEFVRRRARRLRDDYQRAGVRIGRRDAPERGELDYTVEIHCIEPREDGKGTRRITLDVTERITGTAEFGVWNARRTAALGDAERFRRRADAGDRNRGELVQTTITEYLG